MNIFYHIPLWHRVSVRGLCASQPHVQAGAADMIMFSDILELPNSLFQSVQRDIANPYTAIDTKGRRQDEEWHSILLPLPTMTSYALWTFQPAWVDGSI